MTQIMLIDIIDYIYDCHILPRAIFIFWVSTLQDGNKYHNYMFFNILSSCIIARSIQSVWFQTPPLDSYSANDPLILGA